MTEMLSSRGARYAAWSGLLLAGSILCGLLSYAGALSLGVGSCIVMMAASGAAVSAFLACRRAAAAPGANDRRVWRLFAAGLGLWALGGPLYVLFIVTGGSVGQPAFWSQIGFLAAYPFWYRALWRLRQPTVVSGRWRRLEAGALEMSALLTIIVLVGGLLWRDDLDVAGNISQLTPVTLDLLLGAALYNAARRTVLTRSGAYLWLTLGFGTLAVLDGMVTFLIAQPTTFQMAIAVLVLYPLPLALLGWACTQSLQVTDARRDLTRSHLALGLVALALLGPVISLTPSSWQTGWWALGIFIVWRLAANIFRSDDTGTDLLSGLLDASAFERYLNGLAVAANEDQPAVVVGVDMTGFAGWTQRNGFAAGDAMLVEVAGLLGNRSEFAAGVWGRLGADLFMWAGIGVNFDKGREFADLASAVASDNRHQVPARASFVIMPRDAQSARDAITAVQEGLAAARQMKRAVVAFDRGELDGFEVEGSYTASLRRRRERVEAVLADPANIVSHVQPIVDLVGGRVRGHEALSRFQGEPRRGPDVWIDEANAVGLGVEMEFACLERALERRDQMPEGTYLSVNASGELIHSHLFEAAIGGESDLSWLVIEITEHAKIEDYPALNARLLPFRMCGARVAIDDAGAGHSSMRHIIELRPELVKLDRSLINGVEHSPTQQAMIASLVSFTTKTGASLVAEGVETEEELSALQAIGVPLGQGYGIGRPGANFLAGKVLGAAAPATAGF